MFLISLGVLLVVSFVWAFISLKRELKQPKSLADIKRELKREKILFKK